MIEDVTRELIKAIASLFLVGSVLLPPTAAAELQERYQQRIQPLLKTYCLDCHSQEKKKGEVDLTEFSSLASVQQNFKLWQTVLQQVEEEEMPPKKPLPSAEERGEIVDWIRGMLDTIDWSKHSGIGRVTLARLTKQEYNNTLRDLLGVDLQPGDLLLDDGQGLSGFTNDRDALFISPTLAEQYFDAADFALQGVLALRSTPMKKHFEAEDMLMTERGSKPQDLPGGGFGYSLAGAGQRTLYDEVTLPADGWYRLTVRGVGIGGDSAMRLRIDNEPRHDFICIDQQPQDQQIELLLRAGTHQMTWNIEVPKSVQKEKPTVASIPRAPSPKSTKQTEPLPKNIGELVTAACAKNTPEFPIPADADKNAQTIIRKFNQALGGMQRRIEFLRIVTPEGSEKDLRNYYNLLPERTQVMADIKVQLVAALKVDTAEIDRRLLEANEGRIASNQKVLSDSLPVIGVEYDPAFLLGNAASKQVQTPPQEKGAPGVDWILIEGPILPSGAQSERVSALYELEVRTALLEFLPRAFRRPLKTGEMDRHLSLYELALKRGESHDQALKLAFTVALTSPSFLFRNELGTNAIPFTLDDHQLANRLSYFLWMSMPDDELRRVADAGQLTNDATMRKQVKRMIADPKSRFFIHSFLSQWLGFAALGTEHVPDAKKFRNFTPSLAEAMKLEPVLAFEKLLRTGGSLTQLIDGRDTHVNAELAALYGISDIKGQDMVPVTLTDNQRGGLLGMASILTVSSTPNRTSPVLRGKWVLETLLGRHLAEPPADAGQLDDKAGDRGQTLREELAAHRRVESCAGCHDKIDPIGFGLENFDAIGQFRSTEAGRPVDSSGVLPGGLAFDGPAELRTIIKTRHKDEFLKNFIKRLTAFALGRTMLPQDEGLFRTLQDNLRKMDNRADALVEAIVLSEGFRKQGGSH